jgi:hypothetical protein
VAEGRAAGVTHVVGLAGFPSSPVGYPPPRTNGPGRAGADFLRVLSWISRFIGGGRFDPDAPLGRELFARLDGLESVFGQPLPAGVSATLVFATGDLVVAPEGHALPHGSTQTIDTTHVDITMAPEAAEAVRSALAGDAPSGGTLLAAFLDAVLPAFVPPPADA